MRTLIKRSLSSEIVRSIGGVGGAALLAQLIALAAAPAASRLFTQADFGRFGLFFGLANVLVPIALLGLTDAIVAANTEEDALTLLAACVYAVFAMTPILVGVTYLLVTQDLFGYGTLPWWTILLIAVEIPAIGSVMVLQMWLIRQRRFRPLAYGHLAQGVARAVGQVGAGVLAMGFLGLAAADIFCRISVIATLLGATRMELEKTRRYHLADIRRVIWRFRLFPLFRTPSTLANNLGTALPAVLVTMRYGVAAGGVFTLMASVVVGPSGLIQKAVGDVFLGHFALRFHRDKEGAIKFAYRVTIALAVLSLIPASLLYFWGPSAFALLFGEKWRLAGKLASVFVPLLMADLALGPLAGALNVVNRPDAKMFFDAARITAILGAHQVASAAGLPLEGMVALFAKFGVLAYLFFAVLIYYGVTHPRPTSKLRVGSPAISDSLLP